MSATRPAVETTSPKAALLSINTASSSPSRSGVSPTTADASPYIKAMIAHHRTDDSTLLESMYTLGAKLGQGSFGTVRLVQHKDTNTTYACKIMRKRRGDPSAYEQVQREVAIMKRVRHPHIIQLCEVFETPKQFFLIMEYCKGGELVQRVKSRRHCSEADVRIIILRLVNAIAYLHDQGIVHRDIKPENILVSADPMAAAAAEGGLPDLFNIKVSDFGLATFTNACNMMENIVGTPLYMAPEIVQNLGYSAQCDLWSIGVMMYLLLCGYRPEVERGLSQMIQEGQIEFPSAFWHDISAGARNLVESILRIDPAKRITAREVLMHPWLKGEEGATPSASTVLDLMRSYNAERRFRRIAHSVLAFVRFRTIRGILRSFSPSPNPTILPAIPVPPQRQPSRSSLSSLSYTSLDSDLGTGDDDRGSSHTPQQQSPLKAGSTHAKSMIYIKSPTAGGGSAGSSKPPSINSRSVTGLNASSSTAASSKAAKNFTASATTSSLSKKAVTTPSLPPKYVKPLATGRLPRTNSTNNTTTRRSGASDPGTRSGAGIATVSMTSVAKAKKKEISSGDANG